MRYVVSYISDIGPVRQRNEDNYFIPGTPSREGSIEKGRAEICDDTAVTAAVFDGMGGEAFGSEASLTAARIFGEKSDLLAGASSDDIYDKIDTLSIASNNAIVDMASARGVSVSGCAVAGVALLNGTVYPYNVGDCRVYRLSGGELTVLTRDHTLGAKKISLGIYTEEEAKASGELNMLTAFLGVNIMGTGPRVSRYEPFELGDDAVMICSDGLSNTFTKDEIIYYMSSSDDPAGDMIAAAPAKGLKDNITCMIIRAVAGNG